MNAGWGEKHVYCPHMCIAHTCVLPTHVYCPPTCHVTPVRTGAGSASSTVWSSTRLNGMEIMKPTMRHISLRLRDCDGAGGAGAGDEV
eukprot:365283-Chlamydomonas_euryale.AAC.9